MDNETLLANCREIYQFFASLTHNSESEYAMKRVHLHLPVVPVPILLQILKEAERIFASEPSFMEITSPIYIIGDLRGHFLDLLRILTKAGSPERVRYLFLGNIIGTGEFSIETLILVLVMKILWPTEVTIIRGACEFREVCAEQGFLDQINAFYGDTVSLTPPILRAFAQIPFAALLDGKYLAVNGGIGQSVTDLDVIKELHKPVQFFNSTVMADLLWSDPTDALPMFLPSNRDYHNLFGSKGLAQFLEKTKLEAIIRSHQCVHEGCQEQFDGQCITVFSASNFEGSSNSSGVLFVSGGSRKKLTYEPLHFLRREDALFVKSDSETTFHIPPGALRGGASRRFSKMVLSQTSSMSQQLPTKRVIDIPHRLLTGRVRKMAKEEPLKIPPGKRLIRRQTLHLDL